ncbi:MAG TPA: hypothetical protein VNH38_03330 [Candidatus Dormibacteraeota bacterium]|nr:hypothetical protein [Candidatus Dormibacteraeota bacterium]
MGVFGAVPGMTIATMALVLMLGATYMGTVAFISHSGGAQRSWKFVVIPVIFMFFLTDAVALAAMIVENQYVTRITGN